MNKQLFHLISKTRKIPPKSSLANSWGVFHIYHQLLLFHLKHQNIEQPISVVKRSNTSIPTSELP